MRLLVLVLVTVSLALGATTAPAQSWHEVVLHSFDGTDGTNPQAAVIQASDGNFYGTTVGGGANGGGSVFKLTPSGTLTTLYSFCSQANCADGAEPVAGVIQASNGNFYGTTHIGGANQSADDGSGGGTAFQLTPSGTLTTLHSFCSQANCADGKLPAAGLIQAGDGNFYGTTSGGGANGGGTVFKLTPSGTLITIYSFCSIGDPSTGFCLDGQVPQGGVTQGSDGNFYGATVWGGPNFPSPFGDGTVFQLTPSGSLTTLYSFCSVGTYPDCSDGFWPFARLIEGSDGNFYGAAGGGGAAGYGDIGGTVFKLTPSGAVTTLYSFCSKGSAVECTDGYEPWAGLTQGSDGNFYGTTLHGGANSLDGSGTVFEITPSGSLTTLYSFCSQVNCADGANPFAGVLQGGDGNLYGATAGGGTNNDGTVFELSPSPGRIKVAPTKLTLKAAPNTTASASITIENTGTGPVAVDIGEPKLNPPFSESDGGTVVIPPGGDHQLTIAYSPTTSKEKSDSITVKAISNDPRQKKPIDVKLEGED
jgi:uncharacterized repeat protein (TIGR03803 family)